jgi:hypothetical protein
VIQSGQNRSASRASRRKASRVARSTRNIPPSTSWNRTERSEDAAAVERIDATIAMAIPIRSGGPPFQKMYALHRLRKVQ